ncbi:MAG TPA: DUF3971 domain-containing protein [Deltaproteobacteria bacterium]|nr:DUF3971 domain-containing protein [Deltaproteobacteria bacterium]
MKIISKRIFLALVLAACIIGLIVIAFYATVRISPSMLRQIVERQIEEITGQKIIVEDADFGIFWRPRLSLINIRAGNPDEGGYMDIKRIDAYFSLRQIIIGRIELSGITLKHPSFFIDSEVLSGLEGPSKGAALTRVMIEDGYLRLSHAESDLIVKDINGRLSPYRIDFSASISGGAVQVQALNLGGWKGTISSHNMDLSGINSRFTGVCSVESAFDTTASKIDMSLDISMDDLVFPWTTDRIEKASARIKIQGDHDRLDLKEISIITPVAGLSGQAVLSRLNLESEAVLALNMESTQFEYEQVASLLPSFSDLPWLDTLLAEQIRDGKSRFSTISYNGPVKGLADAQSFFDNAYIVQDLIGQSFGAGHGPQRITDISGKVIYGKGGIVCKDLWGFVNDSRIENVNLLFNDIAMPVSTTTVEVTADMPVDDFVDAWHSAVVPKDVDELLSPVSNISSGRIRGKVDIIWDDAPDSLVRARGDISLEDCTYSWGQNMVEGHSGTVTAQDFNSPVRIAFSGKVNGRAVQRFGAELEEPFGELRSRYILQADNQLDVAAVKLGKGSMILIEGTGTGAYIKARTVLVTKELTIFNTTYRPVDGELAAEGSLSGTLWPGLNIRLENLVPELSSGSLSISADISDDAFTAGIKGILELDQFSVQIDKTHHSMSGSISADMSFSQGVTSSLSGTVTCRHALVFSEGSPLVFDGTFSMQRNTLAASEMKVVSGDTKITITSGTLDIAKRPYFNGGLVIEGMSFNTGDIDKSSIPDSLDADAFIELIRPNINDITLNGFKANTRLKNGRLTFSDMIIKGIYGTAQGSASTDPAGSMTFDLVVSLRNAGIRQFFYAVAKEDTWVYGDMDLDGHIWGSTESINGTLAFRAQKGNIRKYAMFSRIFALLNIYKIIQYQDLELTSKNFPYNVISSTFTIRDSVMSFNDFYLDSNSLQLSAVGQYSLKTKEIDAHIGIQPFESVDRTIGMIPLLGWVLTGEDKKLIVVSMKVRGELDDPVVQIAPVDTISNPVKESLFRLLSIPSDIIRRSQKILPGKQD